MAMMIVGPMLATADLARAALVQPDTAVASTEFLSATFDGLAVNTINGSGLPGGFTAASPHAAYASGNHWTTTGGPPTAEFITWGFAAPQTLDAIVVWNHQSTVPPGNNPGYEVTLFDLTVLDGSSNVLLALNDVALAPGTATGQTISFGAVISGVSSVRFDIEAVQSSPDFTGLAHVAFNTAVAQVPVPLPPSLVLTLGAAVALGLGWARDSRRVRSRVR